MRPAARPRHKGRGAPLTCSKRPLARAPGEWSVLLRPDKGAGGGGGGGREGWLSRRERGQVPARQGARAAAAPLLCFCSSAERDAPRGGGVGAGEADPATQRAPARAATAAPRGSGAGRKRRRTRRNRRWCRSVPPRAVPGGRRLDSKRPLRASDDAAAGARALWNHTGARVEMHRDGGVLCWRKDGTRHITGRTEDADIKAALLKMVPGNTADLDEGMVEMIKSLKEVGVHWLM
nr:uncharacterized protein LOC125637402 [Caretta caretta]